MAKITKSRSRAPLANGKPAFSLNHSDNSVNVMVRLDAETAAGKGTYLTLNLSSLELDRLASFRQDSGLTHTYCPSLAATSLAEDEKYKDFKNGVEGIEQVAKALKMAVTMLHTFMPGTEQDSNATLAYIAAVNKGG